MRPPLRPGGPRAQRAAQSWRRREQAGGRRRHALPSLRRDSQEGGLGRPVDTYSKRRVEGEKGRRGPKL